jgi:hypothetical protein
MVIVNDFEFQLVSAKDKIPFKEYTKDGKTYVEVEPDAEYFLSVKKVTHKASKVKCEYRVDGKDLQSTKTYFRPKRRAHFVGNHSRSEGIKHKNALKFVRASFKNTNDKSRSTMAGMGKVELVVHNAIFDGQRKRRDPKASYPTFTAPTIRINDEAYITMKKDLRSGEGHHVESKPYDKNTVRKCYKKGDHLYTITLHYCATPGLIAVGVLPKPPLWDYHRILEPSKNTAEEKAKLNKFVRSVKRTRNGSEILELNDDDGTESNIGDSKQTDDVLYVGDVDPNLRRFKRSRAKSLSSTR